MKTTVELTQEEALPLLRGDLAPDPAAGAAA